MKGLVEICKEHGFFIWWPYTERKRPAKILCPWPNCQKGTKAFAVEMVGPSESRSVGVDSGTPEQVDIKVDTFIRRKVYVPGARDTLTLTYSWEKVES